MSGSIGLNVDPLNPAGRADPGLLRRLGFSWVRLVARSGVAGYVYDCRQAGLKVLTVLARESFPDLRNTSYQAFIYAESLRPDAVQIGNEPDCEGPSSWTMSQEDYAELVYRCRAGVQVASKSIPLVGAGLASGQPDWWRTLADPPLPLDALACHPYGKTADEARSLIRAYKSISRLPTWVTEWNRPADEIAGFVSMLQQEAEVSCWFAATNGMENGFGLLDAPEKLAAMKEALSMNVNIPELDQLQRRIELLEKQQALTVAVLKLIVQGRWTGEMPNAEAVLKAIDPNDTSWQAVPFARG